MQYDVPSVVGSSNVSLVTSDEFFCTTSCRQGPSLKRITKHFWYISSRENVLESLFV